MSNKNSKDQNETPKSVSKEIIKMYHKTLKYNYKTHRNTLNALVKISPSSLSLSKSLTSSQLHSLQSFHIQSLQLIKPSPSPFPSSPSPSPLPSFSSTSTVINVTPPLPPLPPLPQPPLPLI